MSPAIRKVMAEDLEPLVTLWHNGWMEAHAAHVPEDLKRLRTRASFAERLIAFGDDARVAGPVGAPLGFCAIDGAEIDQLYVGPSARGSGLARALLEDGAARIRAAGFDTAFLYCEPKNDRAARFYEKCGWRNTGQRVVSLDTSEGPFALPVIIFENSL